MQNINKNRAKNHHISLKVERKLKKFLFLLFPSSGNLCFRIFERKISCPQGINFFRQAQVQGVEKNYIFKDFFKSKKKFHCPYP